MQPIDEAAVGAWNPDQEPKPSVSAWDVRPEERYFTGRRPQMFIVEPPDGDLLEAALFQIANVRSVGVMNFQSNEGGAVLTVPPEFETGTPMEVLKELGLILTDLTSEQAMDLQERGFKVFVNEVRYVPPMPPITTLPTVAAQQIENAAVAMTWGLTAIGLTEESAYAGRGIKVAVLDTGCDPTHPDLAGRIAQNNVMSFVVGESAVDGHGHGTHVCGTVGAKKQPASGTRYSVAPDCELLVGKVLSNSGSGYDTWILKGVNWAISQGAEVINMSLGSARGVGDPANAKYETLARNALNRPTPSLIIAAAGNDSARPTYVAPVGNPAACDSIVGVAATDSQGVVARFSCGQVDHVTLDLAGPGVNILSASLGGGVVSFNGTSMASPHVAGAAALWAESAPGLRGRALRAKLLATIKPLAGTVQEVGAGLVQAP